jgi:hypothetical protein
MALEKIKIDLTTQSKVFNPVSSAGTWIHHRFGRRKFTESLDLNVLINFLDKLTDLKTVELESYFGDSLCYSGIVDLLTYLKSRNLTVSCTTYGMFNSEVLNSVNQNQVYVTFNVCGLGTLCGSVFLNAVWDTVYNNIQECNNAGINFHTYKHNQHQANQLNLFSTKTVNIVQGILVNEDHSNIINDQGVWLYDVHRNNHVGNTLVKTVSGWNILKNYVKPESGSSIESVDISSLPGYDLPLTSNYESVVTVKGHVIKGPEYAYILSNAYCADWNYKKLNAQNKYDRHIIAVLKNVQSLLPKRNIYLADIEELLQDITQQTQF